MADKKIAEKNSNAQHHLITVTPDCKYPPEKPDMFPKRILFLGHEASRTGAPILLNSIISWLTKRHDIEAKCITSRSGTLFDKPIYPWPVFSLEDPLRENTLTVIYDYFSKKKPTLFRPRVQRFIGNRFKPDLIYVNSIDCAELALDILSRYPFTPVLLHIHELTAFIRYKRKTADLDTLLGRATKIVAASDSVKQCLLREFSIAEDRIVTIYEHICVEPITDSEIFECRKNVFDRLNMAAGDKLVLGCGTACLRKGIDLFVRVARLCRTPQAHFLWIGRHHPIDLEILKLEAENLGIGEKCHFLGEVENPTEFLAAADILALTSREDPYPLAMLEASAFGTPVVGFEGSGGFTELAKNTGALKVPYIDCGQMATAIDTLLSDSASREKLGAKGKDFVLRHHSLEITVPQIEKCIREIKRVQ